MIFDILNIKQYAMVAGIAFVVGAGIGAWPTFKLTSSYYKNEISTIKNVNLENEKKSKEALDLANADLRQIKDIVEDKNAKYNKEVSDLNDKYSALIRKSGGLRDPGGSCPKPRNTIPTPGSSGPTSRTGLPENTDGTNGSDSTVLVTTEPEQEQGVTLSSETSLFLLSQAEKADKVVGQFLTCQQYLTEVKRKVDEFNLKFGSGKPPPGAFKE